MKRTAYLIEEAKQGESCKLSKTKITCVSYGEMDDGTTVWQDIETKNQYGLTRQLGTYFFYKF